MNYDGPLIDSDEDHEAWVLNHESERDEAEEDETRPIAKCAECGCGLVMDETASLYLRQTIWLDPNVLDGENSGRTCTTGDYHEAEVDE